MEPSPLGLMLLQSTVFVVVWASLQGDVRRHGPIDQAKTFTRINSRLYALVSTTLLALIVFTPALDAETRLIYHCSKFYEYVDVLGVKAGGGSIGLHFAFHHLTTPYLTNYRFLPDVHSRGWRIFAALNSFHHALMYAHFGALIEARRLLLVSGFSQLTVGVVVDT